MFLIPKTRPYWHVDAKWITGILLLICLQATLLLMLLSKATEATHAVDVSTLLITNAFSREGLDEAASVEELKKKAATQRGEIIYPIPQFKTISITKTDLNTLSPRELRLKIFRQITEPLYQEGVDGLAAKYANTPAEAEKFKNDAFFLQIFTKKTHDQIAAQVKWPALATLLLLPLLVYFSAGWGRLANPGSLLLFSALPGYWYGFMMANVRGGDAEQADSLFTLLRPTISNILQQTYRPALYLGLALLAAALIGKIVTSALHRRNKTA